MTELLRSEPEVQVLQPLAEPVMRAPASPARTRGWGVPSLLWQNAAMAAAFYLAAQLGLVITLPGTNIGLFWPPSGVALALMVRWGYRTWPGIVAAAVGALLPGLLATHPLGEALLIVAIQALADVVPAALGTLYFRRLLSSSDPLGGPADVARFVVLVALVAQGVGGLVGTPAVHLATGAGWDALPSEWVAWVVSDSLSVLLITPFLLLWLPGSREPLTVARWPFALVCVAATVVTAGLLIWTPVSNESFEYLTILIVTGAAFWVGRRGTIAVTALVAATAVVCTSLGLGPFVERAPSDDVLLLSVFLSTLAITGLALGAVLAERAGARGMARHLASYPEFSPGPIVEVDDAGRVSFVNPAMARTLRELGIDDASAFIPVAWRVWLADPAAAVPSSPSDEVAIEGRVFDVRTQVVDGGGAALRIYVNDITMRKDAEVALREQEAKFRTLFENTPVAIWDEDFSGTTAVFDRLRAAGVTDLAAHLREHPEVVDECVRLVRVIDVNPAVLALHGAASKEEVIAGFERTLTKDAVEAFRGELVAVWSGEMSYETEAVVKTLAGAPRHVLVRWNVVPDSAIPYARVVVALTDVTERRDLEEQLRQAQKMEAIGRLAGGIAHDFNNLLTAINGYADMLAAEIPLDDGRRADVHEIREAGERAAALTRQLLAFSRRQVLKPAVIDLPDVVHQLAPMLQRLIGESIELRVTATGAPAKVRADPAQVQQVILNLAVNAKDAMPAGGTLTIETSTSELDSAFADRHPPLRPGPHARLRVADTGVGMDAPTLARAFEPFFTTKPTGQGTGLGLATVYGIVAQSGGAVAIESEVGRGTAFTILMPVVDEGHQTAAAPARPETVGGHEHILLVEDEPSVRALGFRILSGLGYAVHAAASAADALELIARDAPRIDLLVTDVVLPGMSGPQLAEQLLAEQPTLRVLFVSGYTEDQILASGVRDRGIMLLDKPFTPDSLGRAVRQVLEGA